MGAIPGPTNTTPPFFNSGAAGAAASSRLSQNAVPAVYNTLGAAVAKRYGQTAGSIVSSGFSAASIENAAANALTGAANKALNKVKNNKLGKFLLDAFGVGGDPAIWKALQNLDDPQWAFDFEVVMPTIQSPTAWSGANAIANIDGIFVADIEMPHATFASEDVIRAAKTMHVAGTMSLGECNIKFYGSQSQEADAYISAWMGIIRSKNGDYNLPYAKEGTLSVGYAKTIEIKMLNSSRDPVIGLQLVGCIPTTHSTYNLSGGNERVEPTLTVTVNAINRVVYTRTGLFNNSLLGRTLDKSFKQLKL